MTDLLKKNTALDLALASGRKRLSLLTGFIHSETRETIPLYENFCFALTLLRQKTTACVLEAKELLTKLYAFQSADGNFPVHLHEFPLTYDFNMGLKIAPILVYALRGGHLGSDLTPVTEKVLERLLEKEPTNPKWFNRYMALKGEMLLEQDENKFSINDWIHSIINHQLLGNSHFSLPVDSKGFLQFEAQEGYEPRPTVLDWLVSEGKFSKRLCEDHPHQIQLGTLFPITYTPKLYQESSVRILWQGVSLHSFVGPGKHFQLSSPFDPNRKDLFEIAFYTDYSPETSVLIEGKRGTYFSLGETVNVITPQKQINIRFELVKGEGNFSGHIFPSNRPSQVLQGSAYDWQIGLRTLSRSDEVEIRAEISSSEP